MHAWHMQQPVDTAAHPTTTGGYTASCRASCRYPWGAEDATQTLGDRWPSLKYRQARKHPRCSSEAARQISYHALMRAGEAVHMTNYT
jgi:hypothetical protein